MTKFAFIAEFEGVNTAEYNAFLDKGNNYNKYYGVNGMKEAAELVKQLKDEDFGLINLCSAFDDDMTAELSGIAGGNIKILHADYTAEEAEKLDKVEDFNQYGVIVVDGGLEATEAFDLKSAAGNTYLRFIKDIEGACEAAKDIVAQGATFIELCSWFDAEKTNAVIAAIDGKIPVGTCGQL